MERFNLKILLQLCLIVFVTCFSLNSFAITAEVQCQIIINGDSWITPPGTNITQPISPNNAQRDTQLTQEEKENCTLTERQANERQPCLLAGHMETVAENGSGEVQQYGVGEANTMLRHCYLKYIKRKRNERITAGAREYFPTDYPWNFMEASPATVNQAALNLKEDGLKFNSRNVPFGGAGKPFGNESLPEREMTTYAGGDTFKSCQNMADKDWKLLVKDFRNRNEFQKLDDLFKKKWHKAISDVQGELTKREVIPTISDSKSTLAGKIATYQSQIENAATLGKQLFTLTRKCSAAIWLTSYSIDWDDEEETSASGNKSTFDGKISCRTVGPETQDFIPCKAMVTAYNAAQVADKAAETIQEVDYMAHTAEAQANAQADLADGDHTALLEMQENNLRKQSDIATQRGAFDLAKAGIILVSIGAMPAKNHVVNYCYGYINNITMYANGWESGGQLDDDPATDEVDARSAIVQSFHFQYYLAYLNFHGGIYNDMANAGIGETSNNFSVSELDIPSSAPQWAGDLNLCLAVANGGYFNLIMNTAGKDAAIGAMMAAGIEGAANFAKGAILDNQADRVGDAIDGVEEFEPGSGTFGELDVMVARCQNDPDAEGCDTFDFTGSSGLINPNFSINAGAGGTGGISGAGLEDSDDNASASSGDTDRSDVPGSIGSSINDVSSASGFESRVPGAGAVKTGGNVGGGGGGGGPSAGGLPGGGGGGQGQGGAPGGGRVASAKRAYSGGGGGFSYGGGGFSSAKSKTKSKNPFAKLLGKNKGKGKKSLNFGRQPASIGNKTSNLWSTISNRYKRVNGKGQLLIYK